MNGPSEIARLRAALQTCCEQWRQLTEAEGQAISDRQWNQVELVQRTKRQLQSFIDETRRDLRVACRTYDGIAREIEQEFRSLIAGLLAAETRNQNTLQEQRARAITEEQHVQRAVQNLHHLRGAYSGPRPGRWESYV